MEMYEKLWFLIVPPAMTLLDDFEVGWKISGVKVARALVQNAPPELLKRTGVSDLLYEVSFLPSKIQSASDLFRSRSSAR